MGSRPERAAGPLQALRPGFSLGVAQSCPHDARAHSRLWHNHAILDRSLRGVFAEHVDAVDFFLSVVGILSRIDCWKWGPAQESKSGATGVPGCICGVEYHQLRTVPSLVDALDSSLAFP